MILLSSGSGYRNGWDTASKMEGQAYPPYHIPGDHLVICPSGCTTPVQKMILMQQILMDSVVEG